MSLIYHNCPLCVLLCRMNHGRTKGFESDVETKTTHRVMYEYYTFDQHHSSRAVSIQDKGFTLASQEV